MEKLDVFVTMLSFLLIIVSIIVFGILYHCREYPNIKGGKK